MRPYITAAAASALTILTTTAFAQTTTQYVEGSVHGGFRIVCSQSGQTIHDAQDAKDVYLHRANGQLVRITYVLRGDSHTPRFLEISPATTTCSIQKP